MGGMLMRFGVPGAPPNAHPDFRTSFRNIKTLLQPSHDIAELSLTFFPS